MWPRDPAPAEFGASQQFVQSGCFAKVSYACWRQPRWLHELPTPLGIHCRWLDIWTFRAFDVHCATTASSQCICRAAICEWVQGHSPRQAPCNGDVKSLPCRSLTCPTFSSVGFFSFTCSSHLLRKGVMSWSRVECRVTHVWVLPIVQSFGGSSSKAWFEEIVHCIVQLLSTLQNKQNQG